MPNQGRGVWSEYVGDDLYFYDKDGNTILKLDGTSGKLTFPSNFFRVTLVAGGAAGNHTVTGIATTDQIIWVGHFSTAAAIATLADLTSEFSITAADTINNAAGTDTTNDQLMVIWADQT